MDRVKAAEKKQSMKEAFKYICKTYNVVDEDIRDCTERNIKARVAFIKLAHNKYGISLQAIGETLGGRTEECLITYLEMEDE